MYLCHPKTNPLPLFSGHHWWMFPMMPQWSKNSRKNAKNIFLKIKQITDPEVFFADSNKQNLVQVDKSTLSICHFFRACHSQTDRIYRLKIIWFNFYFYFSGQKSCDQNNERCTDSTNASIFGRSNCHDVSIFF